MRTLWGSSYVIFKFIYFERERERGVLKQWRGRERESEMERIPSRLQAVSTEPDVRLQLTNCEIMTWLTPRVRRLTD